MLSQTELESWLQRTNKRFRADNVHPRSRGFLALIELSKEFQISTSLGSELSNKIFKWFETNTQEGSHAIGALFTGVYYYDACFWPVFISIGYGTFRLNPFAALETMPASIKAHLQKDESPGYVLYWIDCVDFAYGSEALSQNKSLSLDGQLFLENGQREIEAAISQLSTSRPNAKAILSARMAVEIYLKSLLIIKGGKTEQDVKKISHRITDALDQCIALTSAREFTIVKPKLTIFPDISARYTGGEEPIEKAWDAYCIAQFIATTVVRILSGQDSRSQIGELRK